MNIRIMWENDEEYREAMEVLKLVKEVLREHGYKFSTSGVYRNRNNRGGRIYIRIRSGSRG